MSTDNIKEIALESKKLSIDTHDMNFIGGIVQKLYKKNEKIIKEKIEPNWFAVIEPSSGTLIASLNQNYLYKYTQENYLGKLLYSVGLIKNTFTK